MRTVVASDLHLGARNGRDLLRFAEARAALVDRLAAADHAVLLGDVLELRHAPLGAVLRDAEPFFRALGEAAGDARLTIVPGNHDHRLAAPLIEALRSGGDGGGALAPDASAPATGDGPLARVAGWLGAVELRVAYPGLWLRDDVYATHGHYLDCHLDVPTLERLAIAASQRLVGGPGAGAPRTPDDYEVEVQPVYDLLYAVAQAPRRAHRPAGDGHSAAVWQRVSRTDGRGRRRARILSGVVVPAAVGALNRGGLGPFTADLSGASLRRSALRAMAAVASDLGGGATHVVFGHTHRSGPWPRDDEAEWALAGGGRLTNTGSWMHEPAFLGSAPSESPYWPGTVVVLEDGEPPRLERVLDRLPGVSRT